MTNPKRNEPCSVKGCDNTIGPKGRLRDMLCSMHYQRLERYGDVNITHCLGNGVAKKDLQKLLANRSTDPNIDCIIWEHTRNDNGYGRINMDGKSQYVHRLICEVAHGPPPQPNSKALHDCGKGADGCVTSSHLYWGTQLQNMRDKARHGTQTRGEDHQVSKYSEAVVIQILQDPLPIYLLVEKYKMHRSTIDGIVKRRTWKHVLPHIPPR